MLSYPAHSVFSILGGPPSIVIVVSPLIAITKDQASAYILEVAKRSTCKHVHVWSDVITLCKRNIPEVRVVDANHT